jgi:hypothetical protein
LGAGVVGRPFWVGVPFVRPVSVEVDAPAGRIGSWRWGLAVLAPEAVVGLGVYEAVWVDEGDEVEVVVVDERGDEFVFAVAGDELVCEVFDCHGRYPFACVGGAVPEDCLVLAFAVLAPEVKAL